jgi:hypothetical protein
MPTMCSLYKLAARSASPVEALPKLEVLGELAGQDFHGVAAGQPRVLRQIHFAHSAGPQTPNDGVSSEHRACG